MQSEGPGRPCGKETAHELWRLSARDGSFPPPGRKRRVVLAQLVIERSIAGHTSGRCRKMAVKRIIVGRFDRRGSWRSDMAQVMVLSDRGTCSGDSDDGYHAKGAHGLSPLAERMINCGEHLSFRNLPRHE